MDGIVEGLNKEKILNNMKENFKKKLFKQKTRQQKRKDSNASSVSSDSIEQGRLTNLLFAGLNLRKRRKTERLKVCGPRNKRGYGPFGNLVELDNYDRMVLTSDIMTIPIQKWVLKAKHNILKKAAKEVKEQHRRNSIHLFNTIQLRNSPLEPDSIGLGLSSGKKSSQKK
jgi:hypothetical protein